MYLMHMLMLPAVFGLLSPLLPVPLCAVIKISLTTAERSSSPLANIFPMW